MVFSGSQWRKRKVIKVLELDSIYNISKLITVILIIILGKSFPITKFKMCTGFFF